MSISGPFWCPRCGAPGYATLGMSQYSCTCRLGMYQTTDAAPQLVLDETIRKIVREELAEVGKSEVRK
jgi:hypothetical protein